MAKIEPTVLHLTADASEVLATLAEVKERADEVIGKLEAIRLLQPYLRVAYDNPWVDPAPVATEWTKQSISFSPRPGHMETWRPTAVYTGHGFWIPVVLHFVTRSDKVASAMNTFECDPVHTKASRQAAMQDAWDMCVRLHREASQRS